MSLFLLNPLKVLFFLILLFCTEHAAATTSKYVELKAQNAFAEDASVRHPVSEAELRCAALRGGPIVDAHRRRPVTNS